MSASGYEAYIPCTGAHTGLRADIGCDAYTYKAIEMAINITHTHTRIHSHKTKSVRTYVGTLHMHTVNNQGQEYFRATRNGCGRISVVTE